jgi:hypothetical protein
MSSSGRRLALLVGLVIALGLPKRVDCGYSGATGCQEPGPRHGEMCTPYEIEPWGFSLLEDLFHRPVGFAYSHGEDCR